MRKEASTVQWKELYEVGLKIKELEPWKDLRDVELVAIMLPGREEPCFCSVLGHGDDCYGINTFVGYDGLRDFISIVECGENGMPIEYVMREQSNLSCCIGNSEEVPDQQKQVIKELGLKFREKNQWLYFESYKKGFIPYILDEEETLFLTKCLQQFIGAFESYKNQEIKVDFKGGNMLLSRYDAKNKVWVNESAPLPFFENEWPLIILEDEVLKAKMKKQPQVNAVLEIDMAYMQGAVTDKKYERPVNPKLLLLMDHPDELIINQAILTDESDEVEEVIDIIIEFILEQGRPKQIMIRNPYIESLLSDLCEHCKISLVMQNKLEAVDVFLEEFSRFR